MIILHGFLVSTFQIGKLMLNMDFINVFNRKATGFHKQTKHFELNFFMKKNFSLDCQTRPVVASWHTPYKKPNGERALACNMRSRETRLRNRNV